MITHDKKKRANSFWVWLFFAIVTNLLGAFLKDTGTLNPLIVLGGILSAFCAAFFWFKAFYHWSLAKGKSGWWAIGGILSVFAPILFYAMKDESGIRNISGVKDAHRIKDNSGTKNKEGNTCPSCGNEYNNSDYDPAIEHIYCSICKTELLR